jgi:hypothetical protein
VFGNTMLSDAKFDGSVVVDAERILVRYSVDTLSRLACLVAVDKNALSPHCT